MCLLDFEVKIELQIVSKYGNLKVKFSSSDDFAFGHDISKEVSDLINFTLLNQNIFDIIEEDFELGISAGVPVVDLLIINCIMSYLEH